MVSEISKVATVAKSCIVRRSTKEAEVVDDRSDFKIANSVGQRGIAEFCAEISHENDRKTSGRRAIIDKICGGGALLRSNRVSEPT